MGFTLPLFFTLLLLSTLPTLLLSTVVQARALTSPSRSLTRERRGPPARPRLSGPRSPLYPRLIPSVTRLSPVWLSISDRELSLAVDWLEDMGLLEGMDSLEGLDLEDTAL